jgi:glycosyltransferase involved in cell wall biosynthesis
MKISVVMPVRNGARTIEMTLASVLLQTVPADEILILDDGSTDSTASIVSSYQEPVRLLRQENRGVAPSRNTLCVEARGDLIAFLDADDLWHPRYLQLQKKLFSDYPNAVAFFTGHMNFFGYGSYEWNEKLTDIDASIELIDPLSFLQRYNQATGPFASMSYCCVPKSVLRSIGLEPFRVSSVDDSHLCTLLPLWGPVVYASVPLVAYRVTNEAQSVNHLKTFGCWVNVFEILEECYERRADPKLLKAFKMAFASKRRQYGKLLMAAGRVAEARREFWRSAGDSRIPLSVAKSLGLLLASHMPSPLQPQWPPVYRQWREADHGDSAVNR